MSINAQNFAIAVVPRQALVPTTGAATTNGTAIDLEATPIGNEVGIIAVLAVASSSTAVFKLQASSDNSNWYDIPGTTTPSLTAVKAFPISIGNARLQQLLRAAQVAASATPGDARYIRLVATTTGSSTVVYGIFTPFQLSEAPYANLVAGTDYILIGN